MTQKQLEVYLWGAANILRGMIDEAWIIKRRISEAAQRDIGVI